MPFFNFRRGGANAAPTAGSAAPTESVEVMRKRAKHRLIGAAVLVLIGVVGFPLLFDTQPRPLAVDIPIEIPGKNSVRPLNPPPAKGPAAAPAAASGEKVADTASLAPKEEILPSKPAPAQVTQALPAIKNEAKPEPKAEPKPEVKAQAKPEAKSEAKPAPKPAAGDDAARASALLNGGDQAPAKPSGAEVEGRMVVQVGAFADVAKAREARLKLEKAGLKTYTQVAETKDGKRIRVRVGPFASKAEAEKAASKIKSLDLPAAILTL
ncbi:SPOR domain-containing protein [Polaromonas sp.]|uniref:SPOR domain-containing protein n=1 Tax=Polaromonas sp. TaxID=1869339 RepID=UPI00286CD0EC|nr:SPOR domain-containing protein [Polaromonas sp.]